MMMGKVPMTPLMMMRGNDDDDDDKRREEEDNHDDDDQPKCMTNMHASRSLFQKSSLIVEVLITNPLNALGQSFSGTEKSTPKLAQRDSKQTVPHSVLPWDQTQGLWI